MTDKTKAAGAAAADVAVVRFYGGAIEFVTAAAADALEAAEEGRRATDRDLAIAGVMPPAPPAA